MLTKLDKELKLNSDKKYALLINGLGATPLMEQFVYANDVFNWLDKRGVKPAFTKVGDILTSIDMTGISTTLLELPSDSEEWLKYLNYPTRTIGWTQAKED